MSMYSFDLIVDVPEFSDAMVETLYEACDDCTLSSSAGVAGIGFDREAKSFQDALVSAIRDVHSVGVVNVIRVDSDVVSTGEIAERIGKSREAVRRYASGHLGPGNFPTAVSTSRYNWGEVAAWLLENGQVDDDGANELHGAAATVPVVQMINGMLAIKRHVPTQTALVDLWKAVPAPQAGC